MILNSNVNKEDRIVAAASTLFWKFGIRSVTMDNVARECGVSKKTLYQYFMDKAQLVDTVVRKMAAHHQAQLTEIEQAGKNVIEEVCSEFKIYVSALFSIHAAFFYDLEKTFCYSWNVLIGLNSEYSYPFVINNLEKGIIKGYYRADLNIAATAANRIAQLKILFTRNIHDADTKNLLNDPDQVNLFYLHAITNTEGKKLMEKVLEDNKNEEKHLLSV